MRFRSSVALLCCFILTVCFSVADQLFDDSAMEDFELFAPDDSGDQLAQSLFTPADMLPSSEFSTPLFSAPNILADNEALDCSSFDNDQNQFIGKRLDLGGDEKPLVCPSSIYGVKRTNPGKYPGFNRDHDPLVRADFWGPEDEEFCPQIYSLPSFLVCDSGNIMDRVLHVSSGKYDLNNCIRSTILTACFCFLFELFFFLLRPLSLFYRILK